MQNSERKNRFLPVIDIQNGRLFLRQFLLLLAVYSPVLSAPVLAQTATNTPDTHSQQILSQADIEPMQAIMANPEEVAALPACVEDTTRASGPDLKPGAKDSVQLLRFFKQPDGALQCEIAVTATVTSQEGTAPLWQRSQIVVNGSTFSCIPNGEVRNCTFKVEGASARAILDLVLKNTGAGTYAVNLEGTIDEEWIIVPSNLPFEMYLSTTFQSAVQE